MPPLRVLIADDHQLFAETLGLTLDFDERVEVAGSARNGKEAVRLALDLQPDAVLMDLEMPVLDGFRRNAAPRGAPPRVPGGRPHRFPLLRGRPPGAQRRGRRLPEQGLLDSSTSSSRCSRPALAFCRRLPTLSVRPHSRTRSPSHECRTLIPESAATAEAAQAGLLYERYAGQLLGFCRRGCRHARRPRTRSSRPS